MTTEVLVSSAPKFSMSFFVMVDAEANEEEAAMVIARAAADVAVMIRVVIVRNYTPYVRFVNKGVV